MLSDVTEPKIENNRCRTLFRPMSLSSLTRRWVHASMMGLPTQSIQYLTSIFLPVAACLYVFTGCVSCGSVAVMGGGRSTGQGQTSENWGVPECEPPDYPQWGGYGPRQDVYLAGDVIHYYCDTDTYIGGNFYRRCEDTGDWIGHTPVCDPPSPFSFVNQTTTADPNDANDAEKATDAFKNTCTSTNDGPDNYWMGLLTTPGQLFRVMIFLPKVNVAYEVFMLKKDGQELSCGKKLGFVDNLNWEFHNCPGPNNTDVIGVKIRSLNSEPLQLCEVVAHTLTFPTCIDPHLRIENGRLQLNRKAAILDCDAGYTRSPSTRIECVRTGIWNRKNLYCMERQWETGNNDGMSDIDP